MTKQLTEARAALAAAIEVHRVSEAYAVSLRERVTTVEDQLYAAKDELEAARRADEYAESERVRSIVSGGDISLLERPAHSHAAEVERTIAACRRALGIVRTELADSERTLSYRQMSVRDAVGNVLTTGALEGALHDVQRLKEEMQRAQVIVRFIRDRIPVDSRIDAALRPPVELGPDAPILERWRRSVDALMRDATAALP